MVREIPFSQQDVRLTVEQTSETRNAHATPGRAQRAFPRAAKALLHPDLRIAGVRATPVDHDSARGRDPRFDPLAVARRTTFLSVGYLALTALLILVRGHAIDNWGWLAAAHLAVGIGLLAIAYSSPLPRWLVGLRDWHPLALFPVLYKEVELLAAAIGDWRLTAAVPAVEAAIFNGQPSLYLSERLASVPLSEFLHFCYLAYIVVVPAVAARWYVKDPDAFHELVLLLAATMFGSYLFFILYPVDSPFYRFERLGPPYAGHFFFDLVHHVSSRGGARGGAFPSAHVSGAVIVWLVAWRHERHLATLLSPVILGVIVATVYGRFHYVLDSVAGVALALIAVTIYARWFEWHRDGTRAH